MNDTSEHNITILDSRHIYTDSNIMVSSTSVFRSVALLPSFMGTGFMCQKCMAAIC
jgi:hypothetical protein